MRGAEYGFGCTEKVTDPDVPANDVLMFEIQLAKLTGAGVQAGDALVSENDAPDMPSPDTDTLVAPSA